MPIYAKEAGEVTYIRTKAGYEVTVASVDKNKLVTRNDYIVGEISRSVANGYVGRGDIIGWPAPSPAETFDPVNHPAHYTQPDMPEVIETTRHLNFNRGNAVKYIVRAGKKNPFTEIEDLEKAVWYLNDEIAWLKKKEGGL